MSALRDVRLLIARHLDLDVSAKAAVLDLMNTLDSSLDAEGYQEPPEVTAALRRLDHAITFGDDILPMQDALDEEDLVDISDFMSEDDEEDED